MLPQSPLLVALPSAVLSISTDFAPLFVGMVLGLCFGVLAFAVATGVYDTWWSQPQKKQAEEPLASAPEISNATNEDLGCRI